MVWAPPTGTASAYSFFACVQDTKDAQADDVAMKAELAEGCATRTTEFDAASKVRAEEIQAISETIEMLSGDDALELFLGFRQIFW